MTKEEFEKGIGKKVSYEAYYVYDEIYMYAGNMDKDSFCDAIKATAPKTMDLIDELTYQCKNYEAISNEYRAENNKLRRRATQLEQAVVDQDALKKQNREMAIALVECGAFAKAIEILGHDAIIGIKASLGLPLTNDDLSFLAEKYGKD